MRSLDLGWLPVVDNGENRTLLGVLTDRDLVVNMVADNLDPGHTAVEDLMTMNPATCFWRDDVQAALDVMARCQVRRVPVFDDEGRVVGVIAQADLALRLRDSRLVAGVLERISRPTITHPSMAVRW